MLIQKVTDYPEKKREEKIIHIYSFLINLHFQKVTDYPEKKRRKNNNNNSHLFFFNLFIKTNPFNDSRWNCSFTNHSFTSSINPIQLIYKKKQKTFI